jgi:hypothetical protein
MKSGGGVWKSAGYHLGSSEISLVNIGAQCLRCAEAGEEG